MAEAMFFFAWRCSDCLLNGASSAAVWPPPANDVNIVFCLCRLNGGNAVIVDSFVPGATPNFVAQRPDVSFGRYPVAALSSGQWRTSLQTGYFVLPTPGTQVTAGRFSGAAIIVGALGFCEPPTFGGSAPGIYTDPSPITSVPTITLSLTSPTLGSAIHYTTNCAAPTRYSELYSGPMATNRTLVVRAIAARDGWLPSSSVTRSFLFKEDVLGTSPQGTTPTDQQGARNANNEFKGLLYKYPETTHQADFPLRYQMDPAIVAAHRGDIANGLSAVPIVSLVTAVPTFLGVA